MKKAATVALLSIFLIAAALPAVFAADPKTELKELEKSINANKDKAKNQEKLANLYTTQLESLDVQIEELEEEIAVQTALKQDAEIRLSQAEKELNTAVEVTEQNKLLAEERMVLMYMNGPADYLSAVSNSGNLQDVFNRITALAYIIEFDQNLISTLQASERLIQEKKDIIAEENARIQSALDRLQSAQAELDRQVSEKAEMLLSARSSMAYMDSLIAQEEKHAEELRRLVAADGPKGSYGNNFKTLIWPLPGITRITSPAGYRKDPFTGARKYHKGTDIGAKTGTQILSPGAGRITAAGYSASYGYYCILDLGKDPDGNTWRMLFAHQSKLNCKKGDKVAQGDVLGKVGSTGNSTGPHLHFELIISGDYKVAANYIDVK